MASGGARIRSGPQPDPNSLRGASRAALRVLPAKEFNRAYPKVPLPDATPREVALWNAAWKSPQAWAWIEESWRWQTIALWVRRSAIAESGDATAADVAAMIRLGDQIGMTPAGLKENGWTIGGQKASASQDESKPDAPAAPSSKSRFKVINGTGAA
ncbi:hypothetical protein [Glycomyces sp. NPDC048151]|uniref:hypothetical protein n=1 Tax=Glycomyces sp. NPDC048151 TaxID=3364002 RepID=UPI003716D508